jgi:tetratricopeptide (TPR) repeat protein
MKKNTTHEKIDAYILNRLPPGERADFEKEIRADPDLSEEVNILRDAIKATGEEDIKAFRREMEAATADSGGHRGSFFLSMRWALAAAAVVVLALSVWLMTRQFSGPAPQLPIAKDQPQPPKQPTAPQKPPVISPPPAEKAPQKIEYLALAEELYVPYDASGLRSGEPEDSVTPSDFERAVEAYNNKDWKQVVRLLKSPTPDQLTESLKLRAHAYFQLGNFDKAAADFQQLAEKSLSYKYDAEWNLLLCYLARLPEKQAAFDQLRKRILENPEHPFYQRVREVEW